MAVQTFSTNLKFEEVPNGTIDNNILVLTSDGVVKQVPASDFGNSGSDKTLQEVVAFSTTDENTTAIFDEATSADKIRSIGAKFTEDDENDFKIKLSAKGVSLESTEINYGYAEKVTFEHDGIQLQSSEPDYESYLKIKYPRTRETDEEHQVNMPLSVDGIFADSDGNIETPKFYGNPNTVPKFDESGNLLENSPMTIEDTTTVMNSGITDDSGLKFANLKSSNSYERTTISTPESFPYLQDQNANNGDIAIIYQSGNRIDILDKEGNIKFTTVLSTYPIGISFDDSNNLFVLVTGNTLTKISSDFTVTENFSTNLEYTTLLFANGTLFCFHNNVGSTSTINTDTGQVSPYGYIKGGSYFAVGSNNEFYTIATDGIYKSDGTTITSFYMTVSVDFSGIAYKNGILYVLDATNNKIIGLNSTNSKVFESATGRGPHSIAFDSKDNVIVYCNYSQAFSSEFRLINSLGQYKVLATSVGTNFGKLFIDANDNLYGVSYSSSIWRKFVYNEKNYLLALDETGKVIGFDLKNLTQVYTSKVLSPLSANDLNSNYPQAKKGDSVHCLNISSGAKIYTKTETGWVEMPVLAVS